MNEQTQTQKLPAKQKFRLDTMSFFEHQREMTALAHREKIFKNHGKDIRYVEGRGWHVWDGKRFKEDSKGRIIREIIRKYGENRFETCRNLAATDATEEKIKSLYVKDATKLLNKDYVDDISIMMQDQHGIAIETEAIDSDGLKINCLNGVVDLLTGELIPHEKTREMLNTKLIEVEYLKDSKSEIWEKFLDDILPDQNLKEWIQICCGYSTTGVIRDHALFWCTGTGGNGKSTLLEATRDVLGPYGMAVDLNKLLDVDGHPTAKADLQGARFISGGEPKGTTLDTAAVKSLTGGDKIRARKIGKDSFEFAPTHKLWLAANHDPRIPDTDNGIWRRVKLVPFETKILTEDGNLPDKLRQKENLRAILAWMVQGAIMWSDQGQAIGDNPKVYAATQTLREESDPVWSFINTFCERQPGAETRQSIIYKAYTDWREFEGHSIHISQNRFTKTLKQHEIKVEIHTYSIVFGLVLGSKWHEIEDEINEEKVANIAKNRLKRGYFA